ncbi:hemerythrin domain-containing protein [Micromonospora musae]|uniref:Hemerythrin domain-containing protein n=1 Tax=Micromonospora musae TaxID=1894970 RepID=A0A3A9Y6Z0_9ACTN|nr:hemerythrin domain-containing protein [Micromonospora musae]RKN27326.1 hemerythrin domain-containing protein [Micromonospora musae]
MADIRDMFMAHTMLRREFSLLPQLVRGVAAGDTRRAAVVAEHAELLCNILHRHHEGEDLELWPRLHERAGAAAEAIVATMEAQHHAIEEAHAEVVGLLPGWRSTAQGGTELADALERLRVALIEHMAMEETEILPLAEKYVTAAEWKKLGEHGMASTPKKDVPLAVGMVLYEGDREVVNEVLAEAPLPIRLLMPIIGRRRYAAHARRVHGTATPPRIGAGTN